MTKRSWSFLLLLSIASLITLTPCFFNISIVLAQTIGTNASHSTDKEAALRAELAQNEAEQAKLSATIDQLQTQGASIKRDIALLQAQISEAKLKINAKNLEIQTLNRSISEKVDTIDSLTAKTERSKQALAELIRRSSITEQASLPQVVLSNGSLSDFFNNVAVYSTLSSSLTSLVDDIRATQTKTETEKADLSSKRDATLDARYEIENQKKKIESKQAEVNKLLALTDQTRKGYTLVLQQRAARAAQIRTALFQLRDSEGIPFATALQYANEASAKTGVRPAFILAILTQETNLGQNVGTCNRPGDPDSKRWRAIMPGPGDKSSRDDESAYLKITSALGLDPEAMPLSCPWKGGWGGAMGPSQFIPTTWLAYSARVADVVGKSVANPWLAEDAFAATALYMKDLGASSGTYTAERTAALKYYAGGNWAKPANAFYGNQVMAKAQSIQENIDLLKNI